MTTFYCAICHNAIRNFDLNAAPNSTAPETDGASGSGSAAPAAAAPPPPEATAPNPQNLGHPVATRCGHIFHRVCLTTWIASPNQRGRREPTCPYCQGNMETPIRLFPLEPEDVLVLDDGEEDTVPGVAASGSSFANSGLFSCHGRVRRLPCPCNQAHTLLLEAMRLLNERYGGNLEYQRYYRQREEQLHSRVSGLAQDAARLVGLAPPNATGVALAAPTVPTAAGPIRGNNAVVVDHNLRIGVEGIDLEMGSPVPEPSDTDDDDGPVHIFSSSEDEDEYNEI